MLSSFLWLLAQVRGGLVRVDEEASEVLSDGSGYLSMSEVLADGSVTLKGGDWLDKKSELDDAGYSSTSEVLDDGSMTWKEDNVLKSELDDAGELSATTDYRMHPEQIFKQIQQDANERYLGYPIGPTRRVHFHTPRAPTEEECLASASIIVNHCFEYCGGFKVMEVDDYFVDDCQALGIDPRFDVPCKRCPDEMYKKVPGFSGTGLLKKIEYKTHPQPDTLFPHQPPRPSPYRYDEGAPCKFYLKSEFKFDRGQDLWFRIGEVPSGAPISGIEVFPGDELYFKGCDINSDNDKVYRDTLEDHFRHDIKEVVYGDDLHMNVNVELEVVSPECTIMVPNAEPLRFHGTEDIVVAIEHRKKFLFEVSMIDGGAPVTSCTISCRQQSKVDLREPDSFEGTEIIEDCLGKTHVPMSSVELDTGYACKCTAENSQRLRQEHSTKVFAFTMKPGCDSTSFCCTSATGSPKCVRKKAFYSSKSKEDQCKKAGSRYKPAKTDGVCSHAGTQVKKSLDMLGVVFD